MGSEMCIRDSYSPLDQDVRPGIATEKNPAHNSRGACAGLQVTKGEIIQPRQDTLKVRYRLFKDSCLPHKKFLSIDIFHINSDISVGPNYHLPALDQPHREQCYSTHSIRHWPGPITAYHKQIVHSSESKCHVNHRVQPFPPSTQATHPPPSRGQRHAQQYEPSAEPRQHVGSLGHLFAQTSDVPT